MELVSIWEQGLKTIEETSQRNNADYYINLFDSFISKNSLEFAKSFDDEFCKHYHCLDKSPLHMMFLGFMLSVNND